MVQRQGTEPGPFFLLYVNGFSEKQESEDDLVQFADNKSVFYQNQSNENIPFKIEQVEETDNYLTENQFTLDKTEGLS